MEEHGNTVLFSYRKGKLLKATYITEYGGPEVLTYGDLPEPTIGSGEVLIRVQATALNHLDLFRRGGQRGTKTQLDEPFILGCDIAGDIAEVGSDVQSVQTGQRVIVNPGVIPASGHKEYAGRESMCPGYKMIGAQLNGGYAQYVKVPEENVHVITADLTWEQMAAIPLTMLTAWHMLVTLAKLQAGETVLIQAVGSGVGSAALQIAKLVGAKTIVTASTDAKLEKGKALGAGETINYTNEDFAKRVMELTDGRGVEVVFDHIGASTFEKNLLSLARGGRYVNCGVTGGHKTELHIGLLFTKQAQLFGSFMGNNDDMLRVVRMVNQGRLQGVVDRVFALEDAAKAHEAMESRDIFGKLVLRVP